MLKLKQRLLIFKNYFIFTLNAFIASRKTHISFFNLAFFLNYFFSLVKIVNYPDEHNIV